MKACCTGCGLSAVPSPSSVVTSRPAASETGVPQVDGDKAFDAEELPALPLHGLPALGAVQWSSN